MDRDNDNFQQQRRNYYSSSSSSSASSASPSTRMKSHNATGNNYPHVRDWKQRPSSVRQPRQTRENEADEGDASDASFIIGTCPYMCPERERAQRERLRDLAVFEQLNGNRGKTSIDLAVKKFSRTISTQHVQASDVRSLPVLEKTLKYLLKLLDSKDHAFQVVHDFIFDRTRSIRQDLSMQNIANDRAIYLYEEMVKFHVISHHKLGSCSGSSISSMQHLNMEQLAKALTSLYNLYDATRNLNCICQNESEFRSLYVLLHLDPDCQLTGESLSLWFRHLSPALIKSKEISFARRILRFYRMGNYKGFLCAIASEASYLQYCVLESQINEIRVLAVSCINSVGYKLQPYSLSLLSKILMMKESDVEPFCKTLGLETLKDTCGTKVFATKQTTFCRPEGGCQSYVLIGLERFNTTR